MTPEARRTNNPRGAPALCVRCPNEMGIRATHKPCCSSHNVLLCCRHYRRTHFVEVGWCCDVHRLMHESAHKATAAALAKAEEGSRQPTEAD